MKIVLALLIVAMLALGATADYTVVEKSGYCTRTYSSLVKDDQRTFVLSGAKQCTDSQSLGALVFSISCKFLPWFRLIGLGAKNDTVSVTAAAAAADLVFDSFIEYTEKNGQAGYQPDVWNGTHWIPGDTVVRTYILGSFIPGWRWSKITHQEMKIDDDATKHKLSFSDNIGLNNFDMTYSVDMASSELRDGKRTIRPNALKLNLDVTNIEYVSPTSTGVALGMMLATRGAVIKRNVTKTGLRDGEEPEEEVVDVKNDKGNKEIYFSWNRTVVIDGAQPYQVKASTFSAAISTPDGYDDIQASFSFHRIWYSIDQRVSTISWDPTIGAPEGPDNSAGRAVVSMLSLLVAVLVTLFLI